KSHAGEGLAQKDVRSAQGSMQQQRALIAAGLEEDLKEAQPRTKHSGDKADEKEAKSLQEGKGTKQGRGAQEHKGGQHGPLEVLTPFLPEQCGHWEPPEALRKKLFSPCRPT